MRTHKDYLLSDHFSLYEVVEGVLMGVSGHKMNWKNFDQFDHYKNIDLCDKLEDVRSLVNKEFTSDLNPNKDIGFLVTSGWRCKEWELFRKRSGEGQHPIAAIDIVPTNVSKELSDKIILFLDDIYSCRKCGWDGGFAIKHPTDLSTGFAHFDNRGQIARWTY